MSDMIEALLEKKQGTMVILDSGEQLWLSRSLLRECPFSLEQDAEVDTDALHEWLLPRHYMFGLHYAVDLLAKKSYASGEILQKLKARHYLPEAAEMVIYKLQTEHLLNDAAFAESYAAAKTRQHLGVQRIRRELMQKGFTRDEADEALQTVDPEESDEAAEAWARKLLYRYRTETDPRKRMSKALQAMARRGYDYETSKQAIEQALRTALTPEDEAPAEWP